MKTLDIGNVFNQVGASMESDSLYPLTLRVQTKGESGEYMIVAHLDSAGVDSLIALLETAEPMFDNKEWEDIGLD